MALNIKQLTQNSELVKKATQVKIGKVLYAEIQLEHTIKIGYICPESNKHLPIYLKIGDSFEQFQIGKTRIFEASNIEVSGVRLPIGEYINEKLVKSEFIFDYVCDN